MSIFKQNLQTEVVI